MRENGRFWFDNIERAYILFSWHYKKRVWIILVLDVRSVQVDDVLHTMWDEVWGSDIMGWCWWKGCPWGWYQWEWTPRLPWNPGFSFIMSDMTPVNDRHDPPTTEPFFFLDLELNFRFLVWIPSFFIVSGRFTWNSRTLVLFT